MLEQTVKHCLWKLNTDNKTLRTFVGQKCGSGILLSSQTAEFLWSPEEQPFTRLLHQKKKKVSAFHKNLIFFVWDMYINRNILEEIGGSLLFRGKLVLFWNGLFLHLFGCVLSFFVLLTAIVFGFSFIFWQNSLRPFQFFIFLYNPKWSQDIKYVHRSI